MISRRLLRIKALMSYYSYFVSENSSIAKAEKELFFSINKTYELYHYLMALVVEISDYARNRIDIARQKLVPTHEDLNPNTRFIDNKVIELLRKNEHLQQFLNNTKLSWVNYPELIKKLYTKLKETEEYQTYMAQTRESYTQDLEFVILIFTNHIVENELLHQILEEQSIYWNDDIEFVVGMIIKTIKSFTPVYPERNRMMPLYKNTDDEDFVKKLFRKSIINYETYKDLIEKYTKHWDIERIAFVDILLMILAITEFIEFSTIPVKVTLNEYIEICKFYSTNKSSPFINGILDKIIAQLRSENKIIKIGRGLS
ncbi:MAG: transcription termination factor [Bacteroidia bacterium]|nr:MAG: transcription termination factor [Bacteroidia bacterium]